MPELHAQGVELVVNLLDAADNLENMDREQTREILREAADVLGELLRRDNPDKYSADPASISKCQASAGEATVGLGRSPARAISC